MSDETKPWDHGADYYSTSDQDERLTHEDLDTCLEDHFENTPGRVTDVAAEGVTVYTWRRMALDVDAEAKRYLAVFVMELAESIADEYGDPDGAWKGGITTKDAEEFKLLVQPHLRTLLSMVKPWGCSQVGERTFTADELLAWVREHNPEWLEGKQTGRIWRQEPNNGRPSARLGSGSSHAGRARGRAQEDARCVLGRREGKDD